MTTLLKDLADAEQVKHSPIQPGYVRFERNDYHYGQQGQVTRIGHKTIDVLENEAINWIAYGCSSVTWPDGEIETFDMRVSPVEHGFHRGYGSIKQGEKETTGTLSRLPNVFVEYYGARVITPEERETFKMIYDTWGASK